MNKDLDPKELYKVLIKKEIEYLYHANTVSTSITFLNEKHLLSRKFVEDNKLFQTDQYSDDKDKKFEIWDDIFLDAMDIHQVFNKENLYGPFLFCLDLNLLKSDDIDCVRITRKNPVHWKSQENESDWYYSDLNEFEENYKKGDNRKDVGSMLIFPNTGGKIPLEPHLKKIKLDNPSLVVDYKGRKTILAEILKSEINDVLNKNGFESVEKELRHKHKFYNCRCWRKYNGLQLTNFTELKRLFHSNPS